MKKFVLMGVFMGTGLMCLLAADPAMDVEKTPLPSGPLLNRPSAYSKWQIIFSYGSDKKGVGNSAASSNTSGSKGVDGSLPQLVTVTQTKPRWQVVVVALNGNETKCWYDGYMPYVMGQQNVPICLNLNTPGITLPHFLDNRGGGFPDVGWVSAQTYLGTQKSSGYAVFQKETDGAIVWIDLNTRFPARWQKGDEIREFKFLSAPSERLVFPPEVEKLSKEQAHIRYVSGGNAPRGA